MLPLPLEPTDDRADPLFKDAKSCTEWLKQLQLTNLKLAHSLLLTQINEFIRYPMRGLERLDTLESLRDSVHYVQNDYARKLADKPLPLSDKELLVFVALVQLWQAMSLGYQRCLQALVAGDKQLAKHDALLCQRCLLYSGSAIAEYLRTGYEIDGKLWKQLHSLFAFAEERGLQLQKVPDTFNSAPLRAKSPSVSCHDIYVKTLLTCYAHPAELTRPQQLLLDVWLTAWVNTIPVERSFSASKGDAQPLALDLDGTHGLQPLKLVAPSESARYLAMVPLSKLLRVKTILLQQGKTPQQLELAGVGNVGNADKIDFVGLLTYLHQRWCEDGSSRFGARTQVAQRAQLCHKPESIYAHLSGKLFSQPKKSAATNNLARQQIEAYGRVLQDSPSLARVEIEFPLEIWRLENTSILGAMLIRESNVADKGAGEGRLSRNQLIALRGTDTEMFVLGVTVWVEVARTGQLHLGVRYLPGTADAVIIRPDGEHKKDDAKSAPGFLLHAVPALKTPPSLLIPPGWFQPGRELELVNKNGEIQNAKLGISVERGLDYERVSFTL